MRPDRRILLLRTCRGSSRISLPCEVDQRVRPANVPPAAEARTGYLDAGERDGTFRGNQLAFVAAKAALEFRDRTELEAQVKQKEEYVRSFLDQEIKPLHPSIAIRGLGLIWGIDVSGFMDEAGAKRVTDISFENGLIIEEAEEIVC